MAVWLPEANQFYLPPQPITRALSTDSYVKRTEIFYHANTERLLTVGHPFYQFETKVDEETVVTVPKVSANQFRVFRIRLPDPNKFAFNDKQIYNPERERLVWAVRGMEVGRGGPLGTSTMGHPLFNKLTDVENPNGIPGAYDNANLFKAEDDTRKNIGFDPKQTQMFMVGNEPPWGEYWGLGEQCKKLPPAEEEAAKKLGPPIELKNKIIEDGDMMDVGFGNLDFEELVRDKASLPIELVGTKSLYPDYHRMTRDLFGNRLFFFTRREQMFARHIWARAGDNNGEATPKDLFLARKEGRGNIDTDQYLTVPSGSLISSDMQLFNRPYWIQKAQGLNNGILWMNEVFVTVADNTRGVNFAISTIKTGKEADPWENENINSFTRHVEEYEMSFIFQLCKVSLTPENLAYLHTLNPDIIKEWNLAVNGPPTDALHDYYRFIESLATKCPVPAEPEEKKDRYAGLRFWNIDLSERMSDQLDQYALGRKFLFQSGFKQPDAGRVIVKRTRVGLKRKRK